MGRFLFIVQGLGWTAAYIKSITVGFKDKTCAMPPAALMLNFTWEALFGIPMFKDIVSTPPAWQNLPIWFLLDCVIVYTYFRFGKEEFAQKANPKYFVPYSLLLFVMSFGFNFAFMLQFEKLYIEYSAVVINMIMSFLYIDMLHKRRSKKGQSLIIAVGKCAGTAALTFGSLLAAEKNMLIVILGLICFLLDLIYIYELANISRVLPDIKINKKR